MWNNCMIFFFFFFMLQRTDKLKSGVIENSYVQFLQKMKSLSYNLFIFLFFFK